MTRGVSSSHKTSLPCGFFNRDFLLRHRQGGVHQRRDDDSCWLLGGGVEPVFLDLIKDGQTLLTRDDPHGRRPGRISARPAGGTVRHRAVCAPTASATRGCRSARRACCSSSRRGSSTSAWTPTRRSTGRRDRANLALTLLDQNGKPTPGALSLAAVDEAVFSVLDQRPGLEKTFYALEQELLKPVYAIYPWSPDQEPNAPPEDWRQFEQAIFASTATTIEAPGSGRKPIKAWPRSAVRRPRHRTRWRCRASSATRRTWNRRANRALETITKAWWAAGVHAWCGGFVAVYIALWMYAHNLVILVVHLAVTILFCPC